MIIEQVDGLCLGIIPALLRNVSISVGRQPFKASRHQLARSERTGRDDGGAAKP